MSQDRNRSQTTPTAQAVGMAFVAVAGFWLVFGGLMTYVIHTQGSTPVAQRLPPPDPTGRAIEAARTPATVKYRNIVLVPLGPAKALDDSKLAFLGQTDEGYGLWTVKPDTTGKARAGGGGGPLAPRGLPAATGPVFLRVADGRWQPLIQQGQ